MASLLHQLLLGVCHFIPLLRQKITFNHQPLPLQYLDMFEKYNYHLFGILSNGLNEVIFDNEKLERMATFMFC